MCVCMDVCEQSVYRACFLDIVYNEKSCISIQLQKKTDRWEEGEYANVVVRGGTHMGTQ